MHCTPPRVARLIGIEFLTPDPADLYVISFKVGVSEWTPVYVESRVRVHQFAAFAAKHFLPSALVGPDGRVSFSLLNDSDCVHQVIVRWRWRLAFR